MFREDKPDIGSYGGGIARPGSKHALTMSLCLIQFLPAADGLLSLMWPSLLWAVSLPMPTQQLCTQLEWELQFRAAPELLKCMLTVCRGRLSAPRDSC